jgi:hypothetical protein
MCSLQHDEMSDSGTEVRVLPLMRAIWLNTRNLRSVSGPGMPGRRRINLAVSENYARFKMGLGELEACVRQIGAMPDTPPTVRGRLGAFVVQFLQRALFWLIPSLRLAHERTLDALREQALLMEEIIEVVHQTEREVQLLLRSAEAGRLD